MLLLAACGGGQGDGRVEGSTSIDCRLVDKQAFERVCTVDSMTSPDGTSLTVRRPDGGFRRLLVVHDGRGVIVADGAEPISVARGDKDSIDVTADDMVFRLPARLAP